MSWQARGGGGGSGAGGTPGQAYAQPPQAMLGQQQYPNYETGVQPNQPQQPQQPYWGNQQPHPTYSQQYTQSTYQQPEYTANNANQYYQYNQTYQNQGYNAAQPNYQQNYPNAQLSQNQVPQQNFAPNQGKDNWNDSWEWGWDDKNAHQMQNQVQQSVQAQPNFNANVIEESFAATDSWNWSVEDKNVKAQDNSAQAAVLTTEQKAPVVNETMFVGNNIVNEPVNNVSATDNVNRNTHSPSLHPPVEEPVVRSLNDREVVKERIPNLALGKRINLENLTPQWSIESQMSQESSDGPLTQSESTYKSNNQSRNSSKSSPGFNTDNTNFNYSLSGLEDISPQNIEWNQQPDDSPALDNNFGVAPPENHGSETLHDDLTNGLKGMNIANRENPTPDDDTSEPGIQEIPSLPPPSSVQIPSLLPPVSMPQPNPPLPAASSGPPPVNFPPTSSSQNPFKRAGPISHKNSVKPPGTMTASSSHHSLPPPIPQRDNGPNQSSNLSSPSVVNKVSQQHSRGPVGYPTANLETTPDNSERPDQAPIPSYRPILVSQHIPVENLEVAPKNDRNEYLQTAHLSSGDYGENSSFNHNAPPPGLRRMVVGQQESEYTQNSNLSSDEPPPGLSRMVPGQQTDADNSYNQPSDDYMERHIDGQTTDGNLINLRNPFRQADGQQTPDNYPQNQNTRNSSRPFGMDRMVPGEPSNDFRSQQFSNSNYGNGSEQRVVTGVDHDYVPGSSETNSSEREQNMDGSDYSEQVRNIIGATESLNIDLNVDYNDTQEIPLQSEQQREVLMEGENLQDLSIISSTELSFRDQRMDGAGMNTEIAVDRKTEPSDSDFNRTNSRTQSLNRGNTSGDEADRDRAFKASPRREKRKTSREDRYGRDDRKERDDRKSVRDNDDRGKDRRREGDRERYKDDRDKDDRRYRRSNRDRRYDTEDTDYYSDRERERRRYREGSYTSSKPPRPEDKDRRYRDERDKDRTRRHATLERDRRGDESDREGTIGGRRGERERRGDRRYEDRELKYRDVDVKKYGSLRREKDERKRGEAYSSPSRPDSRDPDPTEDELNETVASDRRDRRSDRHRRDRHRRDRHYDPYYDRYAGAGYQDPYALQRQQQQTYQYYEHLRLTNPAAYMEVYKKVMAGQPLPPPGAAAIDSMRSNASYDGYVSLGYDQSLGGRDERGSLGGSGRSSANGMGKDTSRDYTTARDCYGYRPLDNSYHRTAESVRTDLSGSRDFNTDASLGLHLEDSTIRSERMTPFKYSTAHVKGNISSRNLVMIHPSYPIDGLPATVSILSLSATLASDPVRNELAAYPGPLVKGVTHKKTVMEYCEAQVRGAPESERRGGDLPGYVLVWELLILLLRQNGMVIGTDIAELLMKNKREYDYKKTTKQLPHSSSRRNSAMSSGTSRSDMLPEDSVPSPTSASESQHDNAMVAQDEESSACQSISRRSQELEKQALDKYREHLIFGNRNEALEYAMCNNLWGHALQLASTLPDRRLRAAVAARFVAVQPANDPLHTLYATMAGRQPPAATCVSDEKWGDWRPHLAMILSNTSARPEVDKRAITSLGDSLASRGLLHASQFCYVMARLEFSRHPLAPLPAGAPAGAAPRLTLLGARPHCNTIHQLATNRAIFTTEIYEYACGLNDDNFTLHEFQVYKWLLATRLVDCGMYERALAYVEQLAKTVSAEPQAYSPHLLANICEMAERLKYHDLALQEDPALLDDDFEGDQPISPRHQRQWLEDLKSVVQTFNSGREAAPPQAHPSTAEENYYEQQPSYNQPSYNTWQEQAQQQQSAEDTYSQPPTFYQTDPEPAPNISQPPLYNPYPGEYYQPQQTQESLETTVQDGMGQDGTVQFGHADSGYWQEQPSYGYGEPPEATPEPPAEAGGAAGAGGASAGPEPPQISMPNSNNSRNALFQDYDDDRPSRDHDQSKEQPKKDKSNKSDPPGGKQQSGGGWFGGIFNKLSLKPKNQMILPDDKNPTIVWDPDKKRWKNLDGEEEVREGAPPPPPKMADLTALGNTSSPLPPAAPGVLPPTANNNSNIFKMQKGRHIKKSYVDVFNPSGAPTRPLPPPSEVLGPALAPSTTPATNYFVPSPDQNTPGMFDPKQYSSSEPQYQ